jgi:hypothetical protein
LLQRGGPNKSRAHSDYVDWLKNDVGLSGKQIVDMSSRVKAAVKEASRNNRNPAGSANEFDLPSVEHPELAPKPPEAAAPVAPPVAPEKPAAVEPVAAPETAAPPPKGTVASMLGEPVKAPVIGAKGRQIASTKLSFGSEVDKLGYLHANADPETKVMLANELKARGIRDPDAFAAQVQAQVKSVVKRSALNSKSVPAETKIGAIVPHVMQGVPLPKKGTKGPKA